MGIVSTRIDDKTKAEADEVANRIGIPLSTAINIFVKRFISEQGFPFSVVAPKKEASLVYDAQQLDALVKQAVANPNNVGLSHPVTYLNPETNKLTTITRKE